jgi:predicted DNA-binding antitoxin AbrB/MazE fold protein
MFAWAWARRRVTSSNASSLFLEGSIMAITVEAVYENGVLKPAQPLPLKEHEKVCIHIEANLTWAERTAGMLPWNGDPNDLRRIAEGDEFGLLESP